MPGVPDREQSFEAILAQGVGQREPALGNLPSAMTGAPVTLSYSIAEVARA